MKEQMTGTRKKKVGSRLLISVLVCSLLASCVLGFSQAKAADPINLDTKPISIKVGFSSEKQAKDLGDNVVVDLYKVANAVKVDGFETYRFEFLKNSVYDGKLDLNQVDAAGHTDWVKISADAAAIAFANDKPILTGGKIDTNLTKDDQGNDLTVGLYLIVARGIGDLVNVDTETGAPKYLKTIKDADGKDLLVTIANSDYLEYRFEPYLFAIPSRIAADGTNNTANNETAWQYDTGEDGLDYYAADESNPIDMQLKVKGTTIPRLGDLQITKELLNYENTTPTTVVFKVTGLYQHPYLDSKPVEVYNKIHGMMFTSNSMDTITITGIPAGTVMTITEIYSGAGYVLTVPAADQQTILAEDVVVSKFENDYNEEDKHGYGIINNFKKSETGAWVPNPIEAELK